MWRVLISAVCGALPVCGVVDESGRYRASSDIDSLVPPEPTDEDRKTSVDLSKEPIEKIIKLLTYEIWREETRPVEKRFAVRDYQALSDLDCPSRFISFMQETDAVTETVKVYYLNITGTTGLYWMLHAYPDEHSWAWVLSIAHQRVLHKVQTYISTLGAMSLDDWQGCFSANFRIVLMNAVTAWKRIQGDYLSLLWNGVAFGILGDVTSWREVDEETDQVEEGPGGPPPNVSWSENIIFGNMWLSSVSKWLEHHQSAAKQAAYGELARLQAGYVRERREDAELQQGVDGVMSTFEYLRHQLFIGWPLDKGLVRSALLHMLKDGFGQTSPITVADFGAGGGRYSQWLNETGLVEVFAFDATSVVADITGGAVLQTNVTDLSLQLWRNFDWVLCLDVVQSLPSDQVPALLDSIKRHAIKGFMLALSTDDARAESESRLLSLIEGSGGFTLDIAASDALSASCDVSRKALMFRVKHSAKIDVPTKDSSTKEASGWPSMLR